MTRIDQTKVRVKLAARAKPYWRTIRRGAAIGYRARGPEAGTWVARCFLNGRMHEERIGDAADFTYSTALELAEDWWRRMEGGQPRAYDVLRAVEDYAVTKTDDATAKERAAFWRDLRSLAKHITGELLGKEVSALKTDDLEKWRNALPVKPATKRRVFILLAATLSNAHRLHGVGDVKVWRRVRAVNIPKADRARPFIPSEQEIRDLLAKCEPDFATLVRAAVLTGCRYGELIALRVSDFDADKGTLEVRHSKTGERTMLLSSAAVAFFTAQSKGKLPRAPMFTTAEGTPWEKSMQHRRMRAATPIRALVFYSLRHHALSRQLAAGIPAALVAKNAGTSEAMLRAHYHKLIPEDRKMFDAVEAIA